MRKGTVITGMVIAIISSFMDWRKLEEASSATYAERQVAAQADVTVPQTFKLIGDPGGLVLLVVGLGILAWQLYKPNSKYPRLWIVGFLCLAINPILSIRAGELQVPGLAVTVQGGVYVYIIGIIVIFSGFVIPDESDTGSGVSTQSPSRRSSSADTQTKRRRRKTRANIIECPHCGTEVKSTDDYCSGCGTLIRKDNTDSDDGTNRSVRTVESEITDCPQCNATVENADIYCSECGTQIRKEDKKRSDGDTKGSRQGGLYEYD